jgi:hypothetical protein
VGERELLGGEAALLVAQHDRHRSARARRRLELGRRGARPARAGGAAARGGRDDEVASRERLVERRAAAGLVEDVAGLDRHLARHLVLRGGDAGRLHQGEAREAHRLDGAGDAPTFSG